MMIINNSCKIIYLIDDSEYQYCDYLRPILDSILFNITQVEVIQFMDDDNMFANIELTMYYTFNEKHKNHI